MKIQQFLTFAAAATLSLSALADPSIAPAANRADIVQKVVKENTAFRLTASEAEHMRGTFQLEDGRMLKVTAKRNRLYVEMDGKTEELVPVAQNTFVARDSGVRVAFNQVPFGEEVTVDSITQ